MAEYVTDEPSGVYSTLDGQTQEQVPKLNIFSREHSEIYKGLAIIFMLMHHAFQGIRNTEGPLNPLFGMNLNHHVWLFTKICVAIFTFINGYGMTLSFAAREARLPSNGSRDALRRSLNYSARSALSLLYLQIPVYLFSLAMTVFFKGTFLTIYPKPIVEVPLDFLGLALVMRSPGINGPWWYIAASMVYHLFFPFLYFVVKRAPRILSLVALIAGSVLAITPVVALTPLLRYINYLYYFTVFLLGIVCAHTNVINRFIMPRFDLPREKHVLQFVFFALLWITLFYFRQKNLLSHPNYYTLDGFLTVLSIYGIALLFRYKPLRDKLAFMGSYSTELFLLHALAIRLRSKVVFADANPFFLTIRLIALSLLLAWFLRYLIRLARYYKLKDKMCSEKMAPYFFSSYFLFSAIAVIAYLS